MRSTRIWVLAALACAGLSLSACSNIPTFWRDLGVSEDGAKMLDNPTDEFMVLVYQSAPPAALVQTCMQAYAPIVTAGYPATYPAPVGTDQSVDQVLTKYGNDRISITCTVLESSGTAVTFRHR